MASDGFTITSSHRQTNNGCCANSASSCGSICSASDCLHSTGSFAMNAHCGSEDQERSQGVSAASENYWGQSVVLQHEHIGQPEPDVACQAAVFFANQNAADVGCVGCPCKSCVKTVATVMPTTDDQPSQPWRYQRPQQRGNAFQECCPRVFGGRSQVTFGEDCMATSPGIPAAAVSSDDDDDDQTTLRTLLDRAKQEFTATAAGRALRRSEPAPLHALRRSTPGGGVQAPFYQHFPTPATYRRRTAARGSTSPIPVPSPPPRPRSDSGPHRGGRVAAAAAAVAAATAPSVGEAPYSGRLDTEYDEGDVVRVEDVRRDDKMLRAVIRLYGAIRQARARRPPGRPSEPLNVVIGFEPKQWPPRDSDILVS
ncbi:hypothetical protein PLESTB_000042700 [Pleodorina starrii]|uniref:Uncharacterized protein n=1 Tax=Pleodorina starrii TaxID=330485 RepID=A0A9W6BA92_9CHLO|nr:hypothetical protein PLESTB_000042700 [Pleodorina starrii]